MKNSIRSKLTFTIFSIAVVPMILLVIGSYYSMREDLLSRRGEKRQQIAQMAINQTSDLVYDATERIYSWSTSPVLNDIETKDRIQEIERFLSSNHVNSGIFSEIIVTDIHGSIIASAMGPGPNQVDSTWFKQVMARKKPSYNNFGYYDLAEDFSIPIAFPIYSFTDNKTVMGTIVGFCSWTRLLEIVHGIDIGSSPGTKSNYIVLIDQHGRTIAGPPFTLLMDDDDESVNLKTVNFIETGVKEAKLAIQGESGFALTNYQGNEEIIAYAGSHSKRRLDNFNWGILLFEDRDLVLQSIVALRNIGLAITLLSGLIIFIVTYYIARRFTAPIQALNDEALRISRGDYDSQIFVSSDDELGQLSVTFNSMADSLRQKNNEIEHHINDLEIARDKALVADLAKSDFLSNMSHEIRTPMNAILGFNQILIHQSKEPNTVALLLKVKSANDHLMSLINNILDISKMDVGQTSLEHSPFSIRTVLKDLSNMFGIKLQESGIAFFISMDPRIPTTFIGDEHRLQQVLTNLVGNAAKFIKSGAIIIDISVEDTSSIDTKDKTKLLFSIKDTGIGIKPDVINTLFNRFTQADHSSTRDYGGTGLGLAICKHIVEMMGGEIWINSQFGLGSQFNFTCVFNTYANRSLTINNHDINSPPFVWLSDNLPLYSQSVAESMDRHHLRYRTYKTYSEMNKQGDEELIVLLDYQQIRKEDKQSPDTFHISKAPQSIHFIFALSIGTKELPVNLLALKHTVIGYPINMRELTKVLNQIANNHLIPDDTSIPEPIKNNHNSFRDLEVLIVDDIEANTLLLQLIFESRKAATVDIARNGQEALNAVSQQHYDVIFMDVQMPVMNGLLATKIIRQQYSAVDLPIIAMTANAMAGDREECLAAGMNDYLSKPLDQATMFETLYKLLPHFSPATVRPSTPNQSAPNQSTPSQSTAQVTPPQINDPWPTELEGINIALARSRVNDDINLYVRLIDKFSKQFSPMINMMAAYVSEGKYEQLKIDAHKLAGTAANIGFTKLGTQARDLEQSLDKKSYREIAALFDKCKDEFNIIEYAMDKLKKGQHALSGHPADIEVKQSPPCERELIAQLNELKSALVKSDIKAIELFKNIQWMAPELVNRSANNSSIDNQLPSGQPSYGQPPYDNDDKIKELEHLLMSFQFAKALERVNHLSLAYSLHLRTNAK